MSWHTNMIAVRSKVGDSEILDALVLGTGSDPTPVNLATATQSAIDGVAVGQLGEWTVAFSPQLAVLPPWLADSSFSGEMLDLLVEYEGDFLEFSRKCEVCCFMLEGVSGTYGFGLYSKGERCWDFMVQESTVLGRRGDIPEVLGTLEEVSDMEVIDYCADLGIDLSDEKLPFRLYEWEDDE